jgi:hypothetical protein
VTEFIRVQPTRDNRRDFAGWARAQTPKVRTCSPQAFAVPHHLFTDVPEPLLIGALVDDHRYVSPDEDAANGTPPPGAPEPEGVSSPGSPEASAAAKVAATSPEAVQAAMSAGVLAADVAAVNAEALSESELPAGDPGPSDGDRPDGMFPCGGCDKEFTSERGRDTHRRLKHPEA